MSKDSKPLSTESQIYSSLGASSSKGGVHQALGLNKAKYFIELSEDIAGDPDRYSFLHADGAGTKSIVAYLAFRESGDPTFFKSLAYDSLIMNLDDVFCVGKPESLILSNTIGRNKTLIPDPAIGAIIDGYRELVSLLESYDIAIKLCGGETADLGDLVRTLVVDSTLFGRIKKRETISTDRITPGDIIIGLSNTGKTIYEETPNSSLSSNGYTLARHALINQKYRVKYPEILDPAVSATNSYKGKEDLFAAPPELNGMTLVQALLSPTRTYAPILKEIYQKIPLDQIHGVINCTGGGQTKILRFGNGVRYIKDNLFPCPPIFKLIQDSLNVPWNEMYSVFNMGHRIEIITPEKNFSTINKIVESFGIESRIIGNVVSSDDSSYKDSLTINSEFGEFRFNL